MVLPNIIRFGTVALTVLLLASCGTTSSTSDSRQAQPVIEFDALRMLDREYIYPDAEPGRFDNGKMWTFEYPPVEYFMEEYNLEVTDEWLEKARLSTVRLPNCTGSFVSSTGLIMTNHHCGREQVTQVSEPGEDLLDNGFFAITLADERAVENFYVDQLIDVRDVTGEIRGFLDGIDDPSQRSMALETAMQQVEEGLRAELTESMSLENGRDSTSDDDTESGTGESKSSLEIQIVELYNGGRYSAYSYRRYNDVRLVMAPELLMGYYGGDPDNFTYPRYTLDMTFFRAYNEEGNPLETDYYFNWSAEGASEGDPVFVVGNPGSTSRLQTVSQLEYRRDVAEPFLLGFINDRVRILKTFTDLNPEAAEERDTRNMIFGLENASKAYTGMLSALQDDYLMGRRLAAENEFRNELQQDEILFDRYDDLFVSMEIVQEGKRMTGGEYGAFISMSPGSPYTASTLQRAIFGLIYAEALKNGAPADAMQGFRNQLTGIEDKPEELEVLLIETGINSAVNHLGNNGDISEDILAGRTAEQTASAIVSESRLATAAGFDEVLDENFARLDDPAVKFAITLLPSFNRFRQNMGAMGSEEAELAELLGIARFEVYGTSVPPDATFSLRLADGVVRGYEYNGTVAPYFTTFYGMYDRYHSHKQTFPWDLPARWQILPDSFDLSTPLNIVTTNDIIGGNSGSPLLNANLEVVGLVFDGNIESLSGEFIYTDDTARSISVDIRGIRESLRHIYGAGRLLDEIESGVLSVSVND